MVKYMNFIVLSVFCFALLSSFAYGGTSLEVITDYNMAEQASIWEKAKPDQIPAQLLTSTSINDPESSYSSVFPLNFFQSSNFVVCYQECGKFEKFDVIDRKDLSLQANENAKWDVIEQSNVYYWIQRYFIYLENKLLFDPGKYLKIYTDKKIPDKDGKGELTNNAFFNPATTSLNFLPAKKSFFYNLLFGKINRSGFDPSVIVHEASHYYFEHLYSQYINKEIKGLNEGFADYMANIFLENPKVGMVMLQGKSLRDSSSIKTQNGKLKIYAPNMEEHDLGEIISFGLWKSRLASQNKEIFDQLVVDAVMEISNNPYATIHHFKSEILKRTDLVIKSEQLSAIKSLWDAILPGEINPVKSSKLVTSHKNYKNFLGFEVTQKLPESISQETNLPARNRQEFYIHSSSEISSDQQLLLISDKSKQALTSYWIVEDKEKNNILGIYDLSGELVKDSHEVKKLINLISNFQVNSNFIKNFLMQIRSFGDLFLGTGELIAAYKIKSKMTTNQTLNFNNVNLQGKRHEITLKQRLVIKWLTGLPEIERVSIFTIPDHEIRSDWPQIFKQAIIGIKIEMKDGTSIETQLNEYGNY
jgi:hypothetical protein